MALADDFAESQIRVKALPQPPSTDELLELYTLYKQAAAGDVQRGRPGMLDFKGRAKYDAWAAQKGTGARLRCRRTFPSLLDSSRSTPVDGTP